MTPTTHQAPYWQRLHELYAKNRQHARGVYWFGASWVGKSALAFAFAKAADPHVADSVSRLSAETQAAIGGDPGARNLWRLMLAVHGASVVVLDDLGRERDGYERDVAFRLLDQAVSGRAFVIVTANREAAELADVYGDDALLNRLEALEPAEWPASIPPYREEGEEPAPAVVEHHGPPVSADRVAALRIELDAKLRNVGAMPRRQPLNGRKNALAARASEHMEGA